MSNHSTGNNPQPNKPTLDETLLSFGEDVADQFGGDSTEHPIDSYRLDDAHQAIASAIEGLIPRVNPKPVFKDNANDMIYKQGYINAIEDFTKALTAYLNPKEEEE